MRTVIELTAIANGRIEAHCAVGVTPESLQGEKDAYIQKVINEESRRYLESTDWYVTRFIETEVAIPSEITTLRAEARSRIV